MAKYPLRIDERSKNTAFQVMSFMYLFTVIFMMGILIYRQFILHQPVEEYEGLVILFTANIIFLISALLYFGVLPVSKMQYSKILIGYLVFVLLGFAGTYIKYTFLTEYPLTFSEILDKLLIIIIICGAFVIFFLLFAYLGKRRIDEQLKD